MVLGRRTWLDCLSLPTQAPETARVSWVSRLKVPGASPGLCHFLWKVVLEEASWSGGGSGWGIVHGGGYVTVTNTVLISKATVLGPCLEGGAAGAERRGSGADRAVARCPSGSVLVLERARA